MTVSTACAVSKRRMVQSDDADRFEIFTDSGDEAENAVETLTEPLAFRLLSRAVVQVRITRKLAGALNGLDLKPFVVGEVVDLDPPFARMLVSEGWAEVHQDTSRLTSGGSPVKQPAQLEAPPSRRAAMRCRAAAAAALRVAQLCAISEDGCRELAVWPAIRSWPHTDSEPAEARSASNYSE